MNGNIISLIQENRKLFYRGILRNNYKSELNLNNHSSLKKQTENNSIKEKGFRLLQEIFNE